MEGTACSSPHEGTAAHDAEWGAADAGSSLSPVEMQPPATSMWVAPMAGSEGTEQALGRQ